MLKGFIKRYLKNPLSTSEIVEPVSSQIMSLAWLEEYNKELYDHFQTYIFANGLNAEAQWREEFIAAINLISKEQTWHNQRKALIKTMLGTIALCSLTDAIFEGYADDSYYYEDLVKSIEVFQINDRDTWKSIAAGINTRNRLDFALLNEISQSCYGITNEVIEYIRGYGTFYKESCKRKLFYKLMIKRYTDVAAPMESILVDYYNENLLPIVNKEQEIMRVFYDETVDEKLTRNWAVNLIEIADDYENALNDFNEKLSSALN